MKGAVDALKAFREDKAEPAVSSRRLRAVMALTGMALFVAGFLILLMAVTPSDDASPQRYVDGAEVEGSEESPSATLVLAGLVVSATGLLVATVMPALSFLASSRNSG